MYNFDVQAKPTNNKCLHHHYVDSWISREKICKAYYLLIMLKLRKWGQKQPKIFVRVKKIFASSNNFIVQYLNEKYMLKQRKPAGNFYYHININFIIILRANNSNNWEYQLNTFWHLFSMLNRMNVKNNEKIFVPNERENINKNWLEYVIMYHLLTHKILVLKRTIRF